MKCIACGNNYYPNTPPREKEYLKNDFCFTCEMALGFIKECSSNAELRKAYILTLFSRYKKYAGVDINELQNFFMEYEVPKKYESEVERIRSYAREYIGLFLGNR